ncbi:hypothetical protein EV201_0389 [Ancylomarina subtilis]|uniref:Uncharacterized protein n=1 Tax=Ancylomarina subtilis TaxID=1639035 RepID=A0A4Q7VI85_9BACT|nr:hypothetical protein EV201_0389 [Ancylomarina subtilis]
MYGDKIDLEKSVKKILSVYNFYEISKNFLFIPPILFFIEN